VAVDQGEVASKRIASAAGEGRVFGDFSMQRYANLSGDSGVSKFQIVPGAIVIEFEQGPVYLYTEQSAGAANVAEMQRLAKAGRGLSSFISRRVKDKYERKIE
jgi:hypothetical protein